MDPHHVIFLQLQGKLGMQIASIFSFSIWKQILIDEMGIPLSQEEGQSGQHVSLAKYKYKTGW